MPALTSAVSFNDLGNQSKKILAQVKECPVVLTVNGRPTAVLINHTSYNNMLQTQETLELTVDALLLQKAQETATDYQPFAKLWQQHNDLFGTEIELSES